MSQLGGILVQPLFVRIELPAPEKTILPGLKWGALDVFPSPAYWAYQVVASRLTSGQVSYKLGRSLNEEVTACLLGGHGIPAEVGVAAFEHIRSVCDLEGTPNERELHARLSEPLLVNGRFVRYRFARQKANYLCSALTTLARESPPTATGRALREWLRTIPGIGFKTASWVARNWLAADDVAILDIHIVRAGVLGGFLDAHRSVARDYPILERQFLSFSAALGARPSELDAVIWREMRSSSSIVHRLMTELETSPSSNISGAHSNQRARLD